MKHNAVLVGLLAGIANPACAAVHQLDNPLAHFISPQTTVQFVTPQLFSSLERMSRLVDISYCVGTTGISKPFACASRCHDFPSLELVQTWNTGIMMSDSCGYIAVDHGFHKGIAVAFRGTYSVTNTVVDLTTIPQAYTPYPVPDDGPDSEVDEYHCHNCTVHTGFYMSWENARKIVLPSLRAIHEKYPDYPIHLVGHSLGGAVATLAAIELKVGLGWDNIVVTTFGEPRIGNAGVADFVNRVFSLNETDSAINARLRRVTHADDPVPLLPPAEWGYVSHSGEIFIAKPELYPDIKDVRICTGARDPECIAGDEEVKSVLFTLSKLERTNGGSLDIFHDAIRWGQTNREMLKAVGMSIPRLWKLFFAHRDYFWRLGLCIPGGDPKDWTKVNLGYELEDVIGDVTHEL